MGVLTPGRVKIGEVPKNRNPMLGISAFTAASVSIAHRRHGVAHYVNCTQREHVRVTVNIAAALNQRLHGSRQGRTRLSRVFLMPHLDCGFR